MKKLLLSTLLLSLFIISAFGQCDAGEIPLKKEEGVRDWVKDYDNLNKIYASKKEKVTSLRIYFYQDNTPKICISYNDLKSLQDELGRVFSTTSKPDILVKELQGAIAGVLKENPNGFNNIEVDSTTNTPILKTPAEASKIANNNGEKETTTLEKDKQFWFWTSIVLSFGLISLLVIYFFDRKILTEQIALKGEMFNKNKKGSFDSEDNAINMGITKYENPQKEKDNLEKENNLSKSNVEKQENKEVVMPQNIATQEVFPKQFYLSIPTPTDDGLGIFKDIRQVQANPTSSFYRFELERDEPRAKFWFLDNPNTIQSAIIYPETYINPVCDYEGFYSNAKNIVTKIPGLAVKEGDSWKVLTKAKLRFE
jgi:hypothetical protein